MDDFDGCWVVVRETFDEGETEVIGFVPCTFLDAYGQSASGFAFSCLHLDAFDNSVGEVKTTKNTAEKSMCIKYKSIERLFESQIFAQIS